MRRPPKGLKPIPLWLFYVGLSMCWYNTIMSAFHPDLWYTGSLDVPKGSDPCPVCQRLSPALVDTAVVSVLNQHNWTIHERWTDNCPKTHLAHTFCGVSYSSLWWLRPLSPERLRQVCAKAAANIAINHSLRSHQAQSKHPMTLAAPAIKALAVCFYVCFTSL